MIAVTIVTLAAVVTVVPEVPVVAVVTVLTVTNKITTKKVFFLQNYPNHLFSPTN